jgi:hypothetical protein
MIPIDAKAAADIAIAAATSTVENSDRLGLTWSLRMATVVDNSVASNTIIIVDGDSEQSSAVSMIGPVVLSGRVYVITVPPGGNFIVGFVGNFGTLSGAYVIDNARLTGGGTWNGAGFNSIPGCSAVSFTKLYESTMTNIEIDLQITMYTSAVSMVPILGVYDSFDATDHDLAGGLLFVNINTPHTVRASGIITGLDAGARTFTPRWRVALGAGNLTTDSNCFRILKIRETPA